MDCSGAHTIAALWKAALDFFHQRGIGMVSYQAHSADGPAIEGQGHVGPQGQHIWRSHYLAATVTRANPVNLLARRRVRPFLWSDVHRLTQLTKKEASYMRTLALAWPYDGLAMQVFGPREEGAVVGLGFARREAVATASEIFELHCAAQMAQMQLCTLNDRLDTPDVALSPREVEVLEWIAKGKSNTVIADILGISPHTVDTIVRRVFFKLDVHDRTTAAIKGLGAGLLTKPIAAPSMV